MQKDILSQESVTKIKKEQSFSCLNDKSIEIAQRPSRERPESSGSVCAEVCKFCDRKTKYQKGTKNREKLTQAVDLRADNTIREVATKKGDTKIMAIASRELVAAEAHYKISCNNKSCRRTASSPAGYILYCNIFIIKPYNIGHTDLDVFVCKSFCHIDITIQV